MKTGFKAPFSTAIAIAVGLIVLLGYLVDLGALASLRQVFVRWAILLAAVALFVGLVNLFQVHLRKVNTRKAGSFNSFVLLFAMVITLLVASIMGPTSQWAMWTYNYIQVPIESSLMAVLAVVLIYAGTRVLRKRVNLFSLVFLGVALLILLGTASNPWRSVPVLVEIRSWIMQVPAAAGARGILLGVALGSIATGLRVLMGADRPYGG